MKRIVRIYKYTCDNCGWEAFRAEIIPVGLCSKCGNTNPPIISTEDKEFEFDADIERAAEYVRRLKGGEDPESLSKEIFTANKTVTLPSIMRLIGHEWVGLYTTVEREIQKGPLVY